MDAGMYSSAAGMLDQFNVENNIADNLSNMQTPGFKARTPVLQSFSEVLQSSQEGLASGFASQPAVIGRFGLAPEINNYGLDLAQGTPRSTGSPMDMMIVGNAFFTVKSGNQTLLTRNGSFHRATGGELVTNEGHPVLNSAGRPIKIPAGTLSTDRSGTVWVNGTRIDRLGLASVKVGAPLTEAGSGYYIGPGNPVASGTPNVAVMQGYLETSNVDMAGQTTAMISAQRAYQADAKMLQIQDDTLGLAASDLGKVTG